MVKKYSTMEQFLADYEKNPKAYNMLIDVQSLQEVSPLYRLVINMVFLSTDPEDRDIYLMKDARDPSGDRYPTTNPHYAITHHGLMKIRAAADARFVSANHTVDHQAKKVIATVEMQFRSPTGGWSTMTDFKAKKMIYPKTGAEDVDAPQKAVTGAQDRCIRKAFNLRDHYPLDTLRNPFVIAYFDLNDNIPEVREAKILAAVAPNALLYGLPSRQNQLQIAQQQKPAQLTGSRVDPETGEVIDGGAQA